MLQREREKIIRYEIVELCLEIKYLKSSSIFFCQYLTFTEKNGAGATLREVNKNQK